MRLTCPRSKHGRLIQLLLLCATTLLLSGCCLFSRDAPASTSTVNADPAPPDKRSTHVQYGRYTIVELAPEIGEQDLLMQIVDVTIPAHVTPTIGDALRYVLLRSGYQLCADRQEISELKSLPLPAAHMHLGPLTLREAMQLLVGTAWSLESDEEARIVCFNRRSTRAKKDSPVVETTRLPSEPAVTARPSAVYFEQRP